jgi:hypothetical protein
VERVDLRWQHGTDRHRRWRRGGSQSWATTSITFGRLADGRWFAYRSGHGADRDDRQQGACVFGVDEQARTLALRLAYSWMREGEWRPVPASFGPDARPSDGLRWVRRGADWFLDR